MLKEMLEKYEPYNEQEQRDKEAMLRHMSLSNDYLTREDTTAHFSASNWIVNKERTKVLMIYHNIYQSWAWTGGHADGDEDLMYVALKEAEEETGLKNIKVLSDGIFAIQIATVDGHIKRGKYVSSHLHLDCCFLLEADEKDEIRIKEDENKGIKWVPIEDAPKLTSEPKMVPIYTKLNEKLNKYM